MIVPVIFLSLFVIFFVLYLIGYFKNISLMQKLSLPFLLPCSAGIVVPLLLKKMPDSFHLLLISSAAIFFPILEILIEPLKLKIKTELEYFLFFISTSIWVYFFFSVFYIYDYSLVLLSIMSVIYLALVIFCVIKFELKSFNQIFVLLILISMCFFLNFISIFSILNVKDLSSILLFIGTIFLCGYVFLSLSARFKVGVKYSKLVLNLLFVLGELLVYTSSALLYF